MFVIQRANDDKFFVGGNKWSDEYPDALLFPTKENAIQVAKGVNKTSSYPVMVIGDYGYDSFVEWDSWNYED